jgi:hypothetical protein
VLGSIMAAAARGASGCAAQADGLRARRPLRSRAARLRLLCLLLAACAAAPPAAAMANRSTARHAARPNPWGRASKPVRGKKTETLGDSGVADMYLQRVFPLTRLDAGAVCNDGSAAPLYFHAGKDASTWLIFLQGGEWCWSADSCAARWLQAPWLMSNTKKQLKPPATFMGGMFEKSAAHNPFASANVAYLPYCSSDAWVGDAAASNATFGYHFMGARIFAAGVHAVVGEGLGAAAAAAAAAATAPPTLVVAGCSTGSRGAMMNLDYVDGILAAAGVAPGSVTVVGLLDSPLWIDLEPLEASTVSLQAQTQAVFEVVNASARLGDACAALYGSTGGEAWRCLFGEYRMPTLQTRFLMNAAQDDRFQLPWNIGGNGTLGFTPARWGAPQRAYADAFGGAMRTVIAGLPTAAQAAAGSLVFSTACFRHCVTETAAFWNVGISPESLEQALPAGACASAGLSAGMPVSLRDAVKLWLWPGAGSGAAPTRIVQQCSGFRCGQCTTKLAMALKGGYALPPPPPAPTSPPAPAAAAAAAARRRKQAARASGAAMLALLGVTGTALACFARDALRRVSLASAPPPPLDAAASSFATQLGAPPRASGLKTAVQSAVNTHGL